MTLAEAMRLGPLPLELLHVLVIGGVFIVAVFGCTMALLVARDEF